jgi:lipopolysaccharide transport system permease protein
MVDMAFDEPGEKLELPQGALPKHVLEQAESSEETVIAANRGSRHYIRDLWRYRELFLFLAWRDILVRYKQTVVGVAWAVLRPLLTMLVLVLIFGRLGKMPSGGAPYPLLVFCGLLPWQFFSTALAGGGESLVGNSALVSKVYFPRVFIPIGAIGALLLDLLLSLGLLGLLMIYYRWPLSSSIVWLPLFIVAALLAASGIGLTLSALNVSFRDVKYAVPFLIQMGIFVTPVIYPIRYVPERWQMLMGLNPMVGVVLGFRHALLGAEVSWPVVGVSLVASVGLFLSGLLIFRRMERQFADVI